MTTHSPEAYRYYLEGVENIQKQYNVEADKALLKALEYDCTFAMAYVALAYAYLGAGRLADAVKELEKAVLSYDAFRASSPFLGPKVHYLLGQAYERSGWNDKAAEQYREFLFFWGGGDPGIASVEDARRRLAGQ